MKWLLEPEVFQEYYLVDALKSLNIDHTIVKFGKSYDEYITNEEDVIFHGSLQLGKLLKEKTKFKVYCDLPKYECLYYYPRFGDFLLNSDYIMLPFGDLNRRKEWLFGESKELFIRPSSGYKTFTGELVDRKLWSSFISCYSGKVDAEALVVVSSAKIVEKEWRFVIIDGKAVSSTQYKENYEVAPQSGSPIEVQQFVDQILKSVKYNPEKAWTLDVCRTDGGFKVMEVNSFSCAGLYFCDPFPIIEALK